MIYINDKEVNFIYNLGEKVKEVFSYGTKIWPKEVLFDYMYFKLADGYTSGNVSYKFDEYYNLHNKYLKISTDGRNWQDWTEQISMSPNTKYYVKGDDNYVRNSSIGSGLFTSDVTESKFNIECGGNVMSLCNLATEITVPYCFMSLFKNMTNLVSVPELPVTTLADWCYSDMFVNCTSLTKAPELSATTLENYCYNKMFYGCTSLTQAPKLPATTLADYCYTSMFNGCTTLTKVPELPATTLANNCYVSMFQRCTSLIEIPELPATSLADYCYYSMFNGCTSLTQAPELPSTTMKIYCYTVMFSGCTSLTTAPELQATTLADYCYYGMFYGCKSLIEAPELPATVLASGCYRQMFYSANKLNWVKSMNTTTPSATYTPNWLNGVSTQGIFVKNINATWTTTGVNAVPTGWTVIYFDTTENKYYTTQTKEVECDKYGNVKADYMYFKLADGETSGNVSYQFDEYYNLHNKYLKISTDGSNWSDWTQKISMTPNVKYYVKGEDDYVRKLIIGNEFFTSDVSENQFNIECCGNVMSLCNMNESITTTCCFSGLFYNMTNLLTPPELPSTTLTDSCYSQMFSHCSSLTQAPALPATTLANNCYNGMFIGCSSLTQAPELPATTLTNSCYSFMFSNCSSLTQAPELPATTLADSCYSDMFSGCSSLTQAPELPATTLTKDCYSRMFETSNNLNWIKALFTNTPSPSYTNKWVDGVTSQGVFVKNIDATWTTTGSYAVPTGWKVIYFDTTEGKYYTTQAKEVECDKYGNPL